MPVCGVCVFGECVRVWAWHTLDETLGERARPANGRCPSCWSGVGSGQPAEPTQSQLRGLRDLVTSHRDVLERRKRSRRCLPADSSTRISVEHTGNQVYINEAAGGGKPGPRTQFFIPIGRDRRDKPVGRLLHIWSSAESQSLVGGQETNA